MPGSSVITSQEFMRDRKKNGFRLSTDPIYQRLPENNNVDVTKENKALNCCCNESRSNGTQIRTIDENDLRDLLLISKDQLRCHDVNNPHSNHENWAKYYSFPRLLLTDPANENHLDPFVLQPSLFHVNHVPPVIYFNTKLSDESRPPLGLPKSLQRYFRWKISSITPNSIRNCISFVGFETIRPPNTTDDMYLGSWCKHMLTSEFSQLENWRKVNHYPGSFHLGRKDKLWFRLRLAGLKYGCDKFGTFHPTTFVLPRDYEELCKYWKNSPSKLFIMKPPASARGNGIKVINDISQIPASAIESRFQSDGLPSKKSTMIVQQYISNPCLLENGLKFDLRIYVLLSSVDPLRIYIYNEGLVRFASAKYTSGDDGIIDQYMHLTNYFINKNNQEYQINNDCDSLNGCKWTLSRFWRYLREHYTHIDVHKLWKEINDIIVKTIICCEGPLSRLSHQNCKNDYTSFELFGFDIILDENFKPWILEVNITPSLKSESDLDTSVKYGVIKDMFNLVGYNLPPMFGNPDATNLTDCRLFFDARLYTEHLTKRDKLKHLKYQKLFKNQEIDSELETDLNDAIESDGTVDVGENDISEQNSVKKEQNACDSSKEMAKCSYGSIIEDLTQNDVRVLMLAEDELSRCGRFRRVFPSETSSKHLEYFDRPRYYNLLLDAWEKKYKDNRLEGICRLRRLARYLDQPLPDRRSSLKTY